MKPVRVILVVGAQKIVRDLEEAFRRIEDHCTHVVLVREALDYSAAVAADTSDVAGGDSPHR